MLEDAEEPFETENENGSRLENGKTIGKCESAEIDQKVTRDVPNFTKKNGHVWKRVSH